MIMVSEPLHHTLYQLIISQLWYDDHSDTASLLEQSLDLVNVFPSNNLYNIIQSCHTSAGLHQEVLEKFAKAGPSLEVLRQPKGDSGDEVIVIHPGVISAAAVGHYEENRHNSFLSVARSRCRDTAVMEEVDTEDSAVVAAESEVASKPEIQVESRGPSPVDSSVSAEAVRKCIVGAGAVDMQNRSQSQAERSDKPSSMSSLILKSLTTASATLAKSSTAPSSKQPTPPTPPSSKQPTSSTAPGPNKLKPAPSTATSSKKDVPVAFKKKPFTQTQKTDLRIVFYPAGVTLQTVHGRLQNPPFCFSEEEACSYSMYEILFEIFGSRYEEQIVVPSDSTQSAVYSINGEYSHNCYIDKTHKLNFRLTPEQKADMKSQLSKPHTYLELFSVLKGFHNTISTFGYTSREILGCLFDDVEREVIFGTNDKLAETFMANPPTSSTLPNKPEPTPSWFDKDIPAAHSSDKDVDVCKQVEPEVDACKPATSERTHPVASSLVPFRRDQKARLRKMLVQPLSFDDMKLALKGAYFFFSSEEVSSFTIHQILFEIFGSRYEEYVAVSTQIMKSERKPITQQRQQGKGMSTKTTVYQLSNNNVNKTFKTISKANFHLKSRLTLEGKVYIKQFLDRPVTYRDLFDLLETAVNETVGQMKKNKMKSFNKAVEHHSSREILGVLFDDEQEVVFGINDKFAETFMANPSPVSTKPLCLPGVLRRSLIKIFSEVQKCPIDGEGLQKQMKKHLPDHWVYRSSEEILTALLGPSYEDHLLPGSMKQNRFTLADPDSFITDRPPIIKNSQHIANSARASSSFEEPEVDEQSLMKTVLSDKAFMYEEAYHKY